MSPKRKTLFQRLFSNLTYKLLAIFISCTIWYVIQGEEILEITRKLDVTFEVPQGLALRDGQNASRDVTLRGPRVALSDFSSKPIQAIIKVPVGKKGAQRFRIDKELIAQWDSRIKLTVHDPYINIFVDDRASRSVPVKVVMFGSPKRGIAIVEISSEPAEVTVTGLKSDLQKLQEITTEVVDVGGLGESKSFPVPLSLIGLPQFDLSAQQVVVKIAVTDGAATKTFDAIPVEVLGSDRPVTMLPTQVSVVIQGTADAVAKITNSDIGATIDVKGLKPGRYEREITVRVPADTLVSGITPNKITVEIQNRQKQ